MLKLSGTTLVSHHAWLEGHATTDNKEHRLCCKSTGRPINSCVLHYVRHDSKDAAAPFQPEMEPGDGGMISFVTFWCKPCNETPPVPEQVCRHDIATLNNGIAV